MSEDIRLLSQSWSMATHRGQWVLSFVKQIYFQSPTWIQIRFGAPPRAKVLIHLTEVAPRYEVVTPIFQSLYWESLLRQRLHWCGQTQVLHILKRDTTLTPPCVMMSNIAVLLLVLCWCKGLKHWRTRNTVSPSAAALGGSAPNNSLLWFRSIHWKLIGTFSVTVRPWWRISHLAISSKFLILYILNVLQLSTGSEYKDPLSSSWEPGSMPSKTSLVRLYRYNNGCEYCSLGGGVGCLLIRRSVVQSHTPPVCS